MTAELKQLRAAIDVELRDADEQQKKVEAGRAQVKLLQELSQEISDDALANKLEEAQTRLVNDEALNPSGQVVKSAKNAKERVENKLKALIKNPVVTEDAK